MLGGYCALSPPSPSRMGNLEPLSSGAFNKIRRENWRITRSATNQLRVPVGDAVPVLVHRDQMVPGARCRCLHLLRVVTRPWAVRLSSLRVTAKHRAYQVSVAQVQC